MGWAGGGGVRKDAHSLNNNKKSFCYAIPPVGRAFLFSSGVHAGLLSVRGLKDLETDALLC